MLFSMHSRWCGMWQTLIKCRWFSMNYRWCGTLIKCKWFSINCRWWQTLINCRLNCGCVVGSKGGGGIFATSDSNLLIQFIIKHWPSSKCLTLSFSSCTSSCSSKESKLKIFIKCQWCSQVTRSHNQQIDSSLKLIYFLYDGQSDWFSCSLFCVLC